ncbi:family 1 glycosylhydrolase [Sinorhizobium chiapasense]|uniref:Family 1 glycosylhydrolase n=1 Tax=Sinorhizobium chiapasense TaxID=501572 RepID=A0ABZ2BNM8_9HYPH
MADAEIEPFPTRSCWDLSQAPQDKRGWQSRDTGKAFADGAGHVVEKLSDRARHFFTINEFRSFADFGHDSAEIKVRDGGVHVELAPGGQARSWSAQTGPCPFSPTGWRCRPSRQ